MSPAHPSDAVLESRAGHVVTLVLNRPERRNPLSFVVARDLVARLLRLDADDEVRAIVLTGTGSSFCVGGDQADFSKAHGQPTHRVLRDYPPAELFRVTRSLTTPLIVGVNGAAMGGGFGITCAAHLAIAAESARFALPEIKIGTFPATVLPLLLPVIGERHALDLALTGRAIGAEEALRMGVISQVVADADLAGRVDEMARLVASYSPLAVTLGLLSVKNSRDMDLDGSLAYLNAMRAISFGTDDLHEGSSAFMEKRPPVWRNS